jgi:Na+-translocating ferredoxin:NAD+ oxidoreductase RNF subunit RnfB
MLELYSIAGVLMDVIRGLVLDFLIPQAGIGGGMEVVEKVDVVPLLKFTLVFAASIATVFGIGLAMTAKRFAVKIDPRIEKVKDVLAGAHCGACGYPGCEQYAEAVVKNEDVPPNLCTPGGSRAIEAVARITGKLAEKTDPICSRVMCQGGSTNSQKRFKYEGVEDCRAAILAGGGDKSCVYGCLGYGTCVSVCPFDAIHMGDEELPVVDVGKKSARLHAPKRSSKSCPLPRR